MTEDEGKLRQQKERGERAKRLLEDDIIQEFFEQYERRLWDTFKASDIHDDAGQKTCRLHLKAMTDFRQHFQTLISTGEYASAQIVEGQKKGLFKR